MPENHLQQISLTPTIERQTPSDCFTDVVGRAVATAASVGADLIAPVASITPLLSAAVSTVKAVAQGALAQGGVRVSTGAASAGPLSTGGSDPMSMVDANRQLMLEGAQLNQQYLKLQHDMQQESQQY